MMPAWPAAMEAPHRGAAARPRRPCAGKIKGAVCVGDYSPGSVSKLGMDRPRMS
jgi:hypothetical protein